MNEPMSYWLPDGQIIFAYDTQALHYPPWVIAKRGKRASKRFTDNSVKEVARFRDGTLKRYKTEEEARAALHRYAKEHGLKPAY